MDLSNWRDPVIMDTHFNRIWNTSVDLRFYYTSFINPTGEGFEEFESAILDDFKICEECNCWADKYLPCEICIEDKEEDNIMETLCEKLKEVIIEQATDLGYIPDELEETVDHLSYWKLIPKEGYDELADLMEGIKEAKRQEARKIEEEVKRERAQLNALQLEINERRKKLEEKEYSARCRY